jgi:sporulation protein YqfC
MERGEKARRSGVLERAADTFDLPGEVLLDLPRLTVTGGRRVMVENHQGLMDYSPERIVVAGGRVILKIVGEALELRAMTAEAL